MKKLYNVAIYYSILGLVAGVYFREITKMNSFEGKTMLTSVHSHLFALGLMMTLLTILMMTQLNIEFKAKIKKAIITYHIGLHITVIMMLTNGTMVVLGQTSNAAVSGIAGLGHIILAIGLVMTLLEFKKVAK